MIAFVRFKLRSSAEFAKEALAEQDIGNGEVLNIRWAHDDPNPTAKVATELRVKQQAVEAITTTFKNDGVPEYLYASESTCSRRYGCLLSPTDVPLFATVFVTTTCVCVCVCVCVCSSAAGTDSTPYPHPYSAEFQAYQQTVGNASSQGYYARQMSNYLRYMQQYRQEYMTMAQEYMQQNPTSADASSILPNTGYSWYQEGSNGEGATAEYAYPNTDSQYQPYDQQSYEAYYTAWMAAAQGGAAGAEAEATTATATSTTADSSEATTESAAATTTTSPSASEPSTTAGDDAASEAVSNDKQSTSESTSE
jgi:hypothetical protein